MTTTFSLGGSPSDYGTAEIDSIKQVLATAAGVAVSAVALTLTAGSVIVTATIEVEDESMATSTASALSSGILASASALETALQDQFAADGLATVVTVAAIVTAPMSGASVEALTDDAGSNVAGIVVGVIFSILLLVGGGVGFVWWKRRRGKAPPSLGAAQPPEGNKKRKAKKPAGGAGTSIVAITSSEDLNTKPKPPTAPPPKTKPPKDSKEALETELAQVSAAASHDDLPPVYGGGLSHEDVENEYL